MSATELATEGIRSLIYSGQLKPGDRVGIDQIAGQLGVSRTPVRDAFHSLRSEGLVEISSRVGVFVREGSNQEATDVYGIKSALEPIAAAWAAERGSGKDWQRLQVVLADMRNAAGRNDVKRYAELVERFHSVLFELSRSEVLQEVYRVISGRVRALRMLNLQQAGRLQDSLRQHHLVVEAVVAGDPRRAAKAMQDHIEDAGRLMRRVLAAQALGCAPNGRLAERRNRSSQGGRSWQRWQSLV